MILKPQTKYQISFRRVDASRTKDHENQQKLVKDKKFCACRNSENFRRQIGKANEKQPEEFYLFYFLSM